VEIEVNEKEKEGLAEFPNWEFQIGNSQL